ncbi:hypothetical protein [Streptomyces sp. CoH27]|uniref:hypothetical protein n=1 Tax=Streptomyces sp. CoH27 TaxID=2875763 RepID=UPI001CD7F789|nr:hypothetical protein [Streptomyces sp. CoH27]
MSAPSADGQVRAVVRWAAPDGTWHTGQTLVFARARLDRRRMARRDRMWDVAEPRWGHRRGWPGRAPAQYAPPRPAPPAAPAAPGPTVPDESRPAPAAGTPGAAR